MDCLGKQLGDGAKSRKAEGTDTGCCVAHKSAEIVVLPISLNARFAQGQLTQMMGGINRAIPEPNASNSYGAKGNFLQSAEGLDSQRQLAGARSVV